MILTSCSLSQLTLCKSKPNVENCKKKPEPYVQTCLKVNLMLRIVCKQVKAN